MKEIDLGVAIYTAVGTVEYTWTTMEASCGSHRRAVHTQLSIPWALRNFQQ